MQMKYALIGCGRISLNHVAAAINSGFNIVALCDVNISAAQNLKEKFSLNETRIYDNYSKMISIEEIDIISIATPSGSNAEIAIECCERKINSIIEKPIALSLSDALNIKNAATANNVKATVCHQNRYNKAVSKAMEIVKSGALGSIYCTCANVLWNRGYEYYSQNSWRGTWEQDGGVLMNQGIHNIDLLKWFGGGKVQSVSSMISNYMHQKVHEDWPSMGN